MVHPGLVLSAAAGLVASSVFAYVGRRQHARGRVRGAGTATGAFATWWYGLAGYALLVGFLTNGLAAFDVVPVALFVGVRSLATVLLCIAIGGLATYIGFLYTGSPRSVLLGVLAGSGLYAVVFGLLGGHHAVGVEVRAFDTVVVFDPVVPVWKMGGLLFAVAAPQVACGLALLALYGQVSDPTTRWRLLLVGLGVLVWSMGSLVASLSGESALILVARPLLGIVAAVGSLWAYEPPAWARARYRVTAL